MLKEFREFAIKGNMVDMAVGIIIGAAFSGLVKSLVDDLIMPPLSLVTSKVDFANKFLVLSPADKHASDFATLKAAKDAGAVTLNYGNFITLSINFLLVAFVVFLVVRMINAMRRKEEAAPAAAPKQEVLLTEIRDLLKAKP